MLQGPTHIAGYRLERRLSAGGMGMVFLGTREGSGGFSKQVAIKVLLPEHFDQDDVRMLFTDEARLAAQLNHPNICQVFDFGEEQGHYYLVMEYLEGARLLDVLRVQRNLKQLLPQALSARIIADAARGLHYAHELKGADGSLLGVVHRDISPENIMLTTQGFTKVLDFGIAKWADRISVTRDDVVRGKAAYMSPEQVQGSELDRRSDVFVLGTLLFELLTNQSLFRRASAVASMCAVNETVIPNPSKIAPSIHPALLRVLQAALQRDRAQRTATAAELAEGLENALAQLGQAANPAVMATHLELVTFPEIESEKRRAEIKLNAATAASPAFGGSTESIDPEAMVKASLSPSNLPPMLETADATNRLVASDADQQAQTAPTAAETAISSPTHLHLPKTALAVLTIFAALTLLAWFMWPQTVDSNEKAEGPGALFVDATTDAATDAGTSDVLDDSSNSVAIVVDASMDWTQDAQTGAPAPVDASVGVGKTEKTKPKNKRAPRVNGHSKQPTPRTELFGAVSFYAKPWCHVRIDGVIVGNTPINKHRMLVGKHLVELIAPDTGRVRQSQYINVQEGKRITVNAQSE